MTKAGHEPYPDSLPPLDLRLYNHITDGRIPTPVTDTGLVDIPQLIETVKSTIDPSYDWPQGVSVHHFYWPASDYPNSRDNSRYCPATFRNLPVHRGLVLRTFENWLHVVTEPSPLPNPDVMDYRVDAWRVARDLFKTARKTVQWERMVQRRRRLIAENPGIVPEGFNGVDIIGEEIMHEVLERHFRVFELQLGRQDRIPEELRIVDLSGGPKEIAASLGKLVAKPSLSLVRTTAA